jgi:signal transduction histidine kinase
MIRNRLILAYVLPTVLLLVVAGLLLYLEARASLEDELGLRLVAVASTAVGSLPSGEPRRLAKLAADDERTIARLRAKLMAVRDAAGVRRVFLFDRDRRSLVDTREGVGHGDSLFELSADEVELERVFAPPGVAASSVLYAGADGTEYKNGYAPVVHEGRVIAALGVEGSAEFFAVISGFRAVTMSTAVLVILAIIVVSLIIARDITRPIDKLVAASRRFGRGDFEQPVEMHRQDEFQTLGNSFNEMRQGILDRDRQMQMMLSGIAHEVRNPLGGMELFCGLLAEELTDEPKQMEYLGRVRRELSNLTRVVKEFLEYARRQPLSWTRFGAGTLVNEVAELLGPELGCPLHSSVADDLELTADREKLYRVLINLVRNAGQATSTSGEVRLTTRAVAGLGDLAELDGYAARNVVWDAGGAGEWRGVFVVDSGCGIHEDKLAGVFEPFYTTKEKGSGLGLALAMKIIEEHGGGLAVASTHGQGTVMAVLIPFKEELESGIMVVPDGWLG